MTYWFEEYSIDADRRELRRDGHLIATEPQVFDLLMYLISHRERVISKEDLVVGVWGGRIVSDSTMSSRMTEARQAIGDSGVAQRLIRTVPRKGFRFIGEIRNGPPADRDTPTVDRAKPTTRAISGRGSAERRPLTIVICNMVGSTAISERLDPEDLRGLFDVYDECVGEIVRRHGGFVANRAGDEVMIYFGYPHAREDDAERAVRTGLSLVRALGELRLQHPVGLIQARVGIATGLTLIGGPTEGSAATDHDAIGETPYRAAHLLRFAVPGAVVISASTRRLLGHLFEYRDLDAVGSDGTSEPVKAFRVLGESEIVSRYEALRPGYTELIGREDELELLLRRWRQTKAGEGHVVLLWGEPGIGKSRLAVALQDAIGDGHIRLRFFCSPHRTQTALYPVVRQLELAAGFTLGDTADVKLKKLEELLVLSSQDPRGDTALFADLLSLGLDDRYTMQVLSSQRRKELILERLAAQIAGHASRLPVLIILEDVHWIDPTTRELFDVLIERLRVMPVLLVMSYRPEFVPPWLGQSHTTMIALSRLTRRDATTMIKSVARGRNLPPRLLDQIIAHTDGIPLFIEEMTKSVLESDVLREEKGSFTLTAPHALAVPLTLQASLVERLDRLTSARTIVQTGAALGREFHYAVLQAVTGLEDTELQPLIERLVASGLVHQRGAIPHATYVFKHALIQDAAYETLLKTDRAQLHRRIVEVLEDRFSELPDRNPEVLARHCTEAKLWEKAVSYRLKAARVALDRSAGVEAQAQVEAGIRELPSIADERTRGQLDGRLQVALADAFVMTRGFASPDVIAALSQARVLLGKSADTVESLRPLCGQFNYHMIRSESPKGLQLVEAFVRRRSGALANPVIQYLLGAAHLPIGNLKKAEVCLEHSLSLYMEETCGEIAFIGGYHLRSFALIWLGLVRLYRGATESARNTMANAVMDARSRAHPFTLMSAILALARFLNHVGDLSGAIAATEEGRAIAEEHGSPYHLSRASILRAVNLIDSGLTKDGIRLMESALAEHRDTGANYQSSYNLSYLARAYSRVGHVERALDFASQAIDEIERTGERWWQSGAYRVKGEILLATSGKHRDAAEAFLRRSLACARRQHATFWVVRAEESLARIYGAP